MNEPIEPPDRWGENEELTVTRGFLAVDRAKHFDAGEQFGVRDERERIIELLEADGLNCDCDWCQINGDVPSQHHWRILDLIKGEK